MRKIKFYMLACAISLVSTASAAQLYEATLVGEELKKDGYIADQQFMNERGVVVGKLRRIQKESASETSAGYFLLDPDEGLSAQLEMNWECGGINELNDMFLYNLEKMKARIVGHDGQIEEYDLPEGFDHPDLYFYGFNDLGQAFFQLGYGFSVFGMFDKGDVICFDQNHPMHAQLLEKGYTVNEYCLLQPQTDGSLVMLASNFSMDGGYYFCDATRFIEKVGFIYENGEVKVIEIPEGYKEAIPYDKNSEGYVVVNLKRETIDRPYYYQDVTALWSADEGYIHFYEDLEGWFINDKNEILGQVPDNYLRCVEGKESPYSGSGSSVSHELRSIGDKIAIAKDGKIQRFRDAKVKNDQDFVDPLLQTRGNVMERNFSTIDGLRGFNNQGQVLLNVWYYSTDKTLSPFPGGDTFLFTPASE